MQDDASIDRPIDMGAPIDFDFGVTKTMAVVPVLDHGQKTDDTDQHAPPPVLAPTAQWVPDEAGGTHRAPINPQVPQVAGMLASDVEAMAREMVLYGDQHTDEVLAAYRITPEQFALIQEMPVYLSVFNRTKTELSADRHMPARHMASGYLMGALKKLGQIANGSALADPKDQIKAAQTLAEISGAVSAASKQPAPAAPAVQLFFGHSVGRDLQAIVVPTKEIG